MCVYSTLKLTLVGFRGFQFTNPGSLLPDLQQDPRARSIPSYVDLDAPAGSSMDIDYRRVADYSDI